MSNPYTSPGTDPKNVPSSDGPVKKIMVAVFGVLSAIYLLNPGAGFIDFIPDVIPGLGNLDEAGAATILISCLAYFGMDLSKLFGRARQFTGKSEDEVPGEKPVAGKVVR